MLNTLNQLRAVFDNDKIRLKRKLMLCQIHTFMNDEHCKWLFSHFVFTQLYPYSHVEISITYVMSDSFSNNDLKINICKIYFYDMNNYNISYYNKILEKS